MGALFEDDSVVDEFYTRKTTHIQYVPAMETEPELSANYNLSKFDSLCKEISEAGLDEDVEKFLLLSATRFIEFNYSNIAEYYCHAEKPVQELMEKLGLVIIDYNDAFENGFVKLNEFTRDIYDEAKK